MDPLDRFSAALAAEHDGEVAAPGVTRGRILERLAKRRAPRSTLRVLWAIPLVMLGAGTALAASGRLPHLLEQGSQWLMGGSVSSRTSSQSQRKPGRAPAAVPPLVETAQLSPSPPAPEAGTDLGTLQAATTVSAEAPTPVAPHLQARPGLTSDEPSERSSFVPSEEPAAAATSEPAAAAASEPGLASYAAAQRAHFRSKDHAAAARLYQSYLESAPAGSFVTEARYNLSLCLLRLGRTAEARPILAAFARGAYGGYRQLEANRLLEATAE